MGGWLRLFVSGSHALLPMGQLETYRSDGVVVIQLQRTHEHALWCPLAVGFGTGRSGVASQARVTAAWRPRVFVVARNLWVWMLLEQPQPLPVLLSPKLRPWPQGPPGCNPDRRLRACFSWLKGVRHDAKRDRCF